MVRPKDEVCCEGSCLGLGTICELPGSMLIDSGSNSLPFSSPVSLSESANSISGWCTGSLSLVFRSCLRLRR